jgi:hypothetical protein
MAFNVGVSGGGRRKRRARGRAICCCARYVCHRGTSGALAWALSQPPRWPARQGQVVAVLEARSHIVG